MATAMRKLQLKVADEVWIITALLHRERPSKQDFSIEDIMSRAEQEGITSSLRPGFYVHVIQHCVANRPPNPGRYRILYETAPGRRRLFRGGDASDPRRNGGKVVPDIEEIPDRYGDLLDWYRNWSATAVRANHASDPLLKLRGSGKQLWAKEHGDEYVRRLREGWE